MTPDPTDAKLDEIGVFRRKASAALTALTWPTWDHHGKNVAVALAKIDPLIKALRACRQEAEAKDAVMAEIRRHWRRVDWWNFLPHIEVPQDIRALPLLEQKRAAKESVKAIRAALDNLPSVAKQGETDDAGV